MYCIRQVKVQFSLGVENSCLFLHLRYSWQGARASGPGLRQYTTGQQLHGHSGELRRRNPRDLSLSFRRRKSGTPLTYCVSYSFSSSMMLMFTVKHAYSQAETTLIYSKHNSYNLHYKNTLIEKPLLSRLNHLCFWFCGDFFYGQVVMNRKLFMW